MLLSPFPTRSVVALMLLLASGALPARAAAADDRSQDHEAAYEELLAEYAQKLAPLADQCDANQDTALALRIRQWLPDRDPAKITVFLRSPLDEGPEKLSPHAAEFYRLRVEQAEALFRLAQRAAKDHDIGRAVRLVGEVLREDPAHGKAREILGTSPAFRFHKNRRGGWRIDTGHFELTTDHDRKTGEQLARRLEQLHQVWSQLFASYPQDDAEWVRRFQGERPRRRKTRRHKVVYYHDQATYRAALKKMQPGIEQTLGIYFADVRTSYFFSGEDQDPGTLFHEATHQLFQETRRTKNIIALRNNFWIVEGIACYMESLRIDRGIATVGGAEAGRIPAARVRLLEDHFYVPFAEMVTYSSTQLQRDPRIRTLYSQAAGQAAFLMHFRQGRYRSALNDYLQAVYMGLARPETLERATGIDYERLDVEYREYLQELSAAGK